MRKWLIALGTLVVAAIAAITLVAANLNSFVNEHRDWVASQAEGAMGRPVSFGGVGISLFGGLGVRVAELRIGDDPGFSKEPFLSADGIDLRVAILPALLGNIVVHHVVVRSPAITVVRTSRGLSTDSLGGGARPEKPAAKDELPAFSVASIDITDGTLHFVDRTATPVATTAVEKLDLRVSNVSVAGPIDLALEAAVLGADRPNVRLTARIVDLESPKAEFDLRSSALELPSGEGGATPDVIRDLEISGHLSLPKAGPQVRATARSDTGRVGGADYEGLAAEFTLQNRVATIEKLRASLFGGDLDVSGRYDMRKPERPSFDVKTTLASMRLERLLSVRSPKAAESIQGQLDGNLALAGAGSGWEQLERTLSGNGSVQVADGILKDVNLADAALKGVTGVPALANLLPPDLQRKYPAVFGTGDTVFEKVDTKIDIRDGWVEFRDLRLAARDYALGGQGRYSLENQIDVSTVMTFSQPLSDHLVEAAAPMEYLRGGDGRVAFPVKMVGTAPRIKVVPDVAYIAKAASRQAVGRLIEGVLGGKQQPESGDPAAKPAPGDAATELLKRGLGGLLDR